MRWFIILIIGILVSMGIFAYLYLSNQDFKMTIDSITQQASNTMSPAQYGMGTLHTVSSGEAWNSLKSEGEESGLRFWTADAKDKKTELGWIPLDNSCTGLVDKYLYNESGERILDNKGKDIELKCESSKCDGYNCYHISLTDAEAVNIDEFVRLGENSYIIAYQDMNLLNYELDWAEFNITLYKNISDSWNNTVNSIYVYHNENEEKFGANDSNNNYLEMYKYRIDSTSKIYSKGMKPYIMNPGPIDNGDYLYYEGHVMDFSDICNREFECWEEVEYNDTWHFCNYTSCKFDYIDDYTLEVTFVSDEFIDPTITISYGDAVSKSSLDDVTSEMGKSNFTHLSMSTASPYDAILGYWNFDGDKENTISTTGYDFSGNNLDGFYQGTAISNSTGCLFRNCLLLDGDPQIADAQLDLETLFGVSGNADIAISIWIKPKQFQVGGFVIASSSECLIRYNNPPDNYAQFILNSFQNPDRVDSASGTVNVNEWNHIFGQYDNSTNNLSIWVNGVFEEAKSPVGSYGTCNNWEVGAIDGSSSYNYNGSVDEIMVFNKALTNDEILAIYNNQSARFKESGNQSIGENINQDGNYNKLNLTITGNTVDFGSSLDARLGLVNATFDTTGLVLYMPFEADKNKALDLSGNGNSGTLYGNTFWNGTGGRNNTGGFEFDGDGDYVDVGDNSELEGMSELSVSVWIKKSAEADSDEDTIISKWDSDALEYGPYLLRYDSANNQIDWFVGNASDQKAVINSVSIEDEKWHHIVGTYNGTNTPVYLDGSKLSLQGAFTGALAGDTNDDSLEICRSPHNSADYFNGTIDDVMIFNRSLSAEEILALYNNQSLKHDGIADWTEYQELSDVNTFDITEDTDFVYTDLLFTAGTNNYYSPLLYGDMNITTWYESGTPPVDDTSFTVTLPSGTTVGIFTALNKSSINIAPANQTSTVPFINISNEGNVALNFSIVLNASMPNDISLMYNINNDYLSANVVTSSEIVIGSDISAGDTLSAWFWSNFTDSLPQTFKKELNVSTIKST